MILLQVSSKRLSPTLTNQSNTLRRYLSSNADGRRKLGKKDFEYCVDLVQNRDRESYLCGLLMPHASRRSYFAVRAFNVEIASIKDGSVSRQVGGAQFDESGASMALKIRAQWWHDALDQIYNEPSKEGATKDEIISGMADACWNNPIVRVLDHAVHESDLTRRFLERLLEAREADLDVKQAETMEYATNYAESTFSSLLYLSLETTDVRDEAADTVAYHAGIGWGLVTALRGARIRLARGECAIPAELIPSGFPYHKFNTEDPKSEITEEENQMLREAVRHMAHVAAAHLDEAKNLQSSIPKHAKPCFLPVVPALHHLSKLEKSDYDIFDDSLLERDNLTVLALLSRTWLTGVF